MDVHITYANLNTIQDLNPYSIEHLICTGLMLQLNINQTQYTRFTDSAGVRIAVTHHNELVRPDVFGAGISPGKVAFMGIMKVFTSDRTWLFS